MSDSSQNENENEREVFSVHTESPSIDTTHAAEHVNSAPVVVPGSANLGGMHDPDADGKAFRLYMAALDRTPDSSGLHNWMNVIDSGDSLEHVANGFVNSAEFQAKYGALDDAHFVNQLYQNVLHRSADADGYLSWTHALASGQTREQVLVGFSESVENKNYALEIVHGIDFQAWVG